MADDLTMPEGEDGLSQTLGVVHISTTLRGGAGSAAVRAHEAVLSCGVNSTLVSLYGTNRRAHGLLDSPAERLRRRGFTLMNQLAMKNNQHLVTPFGAINHRAKELHARVSPREVLHYHNFLNVISPSGLWQLAAERPTVVTLHDERLYTGSCHYARGCLGFMETCNGCPQVRGLARRVVHHNFLEMGESVRSGPALTVLAPSRWIAARAHESALSDVLDVHVLPNPIDTQLFNPVRRQSARARWGVSDDFVVGTTGDKGGVREAHLLTRLADLYPDVSLTNLRLGGSFVATSMRSLSVPFSESQGVVADFFAACDVFINISEIDNFPNVNLEALASGTPVVTLGKGGLAEAIEDTGGGVITHTSKELEQALRSLVENSELKSQLSVRARINAERLYSYPVVGSKLAEIYTRLLEQ